MHARTITAAAATAALLALTGCSSDSNTQPTPTATTTATVTASPALSKAEITARCAAAVAVVLGERPDDFDPELDEDPRPTECDGLDDSEYLDAYMDGLSQSNEAARDALDLQASEAAEADQ